MAFTLSAAQTINGVANSYEVTGDGNLDDLVTACAGIGMSRANGVIVFNPGVSRILAVSGALTETRPGTRTVQIRGSGHICFAYAAGSTCTLGSKNTTLDVYPSSVDIVYEPTALTLGADNNSGAQGKCFAGAGSFTLVSGSIAYQQSGNSHFDVWNGSTLCSLDSVRMYLAPVGAFTHIWKAGGKTITTSRTTCVFIQRPAEGVSAMTEVQPFYVDTGFRWGSPAAGTTLRVLRPSYPAVDIYGGSASAIIDVIDPATPYVGWYNDSTTYNTHVGIKRVWRTLKVNFTDPLGAAISGAKMVVKSSTGVITQAAFSGKAASQELLQSTRASGVAHDQTGLTGTGYTDEGAYDAYAVGYGYASNKKAISVKTNDGNAGITWAPTATANALAAAVPYASVVTAPFAFSTATGTVTVSSNCTLDQVGQYLLKLAVDNATDNYWIGINHSPVTLSGTQADFGAINIVVNAGATLSAGTLATSIKSTGTATGAGTIAVPVIDANGDSYVQESNGATLKVYATAANRDARTSALATDVTRYRFTFATKPAATLYLWVKVGSTEYPSEITLVQGANVLDLGVTGQLLQLGNKVDAVPTNVWSSATRTLTATAGITLAQIEASTVLAKEATVSSRASQTSVDALGAPLQATAYTVPDNAGIAAIKAKTDTLANGPTLAQIEASSVLAKEATVSSRASQASVNALGAPLQAADYTVPDNAAVAAIKAKTDQIGFTAGNVNAIAKAVTDKTGYELSSAERAAIANAVQAAILDENDGQKILEAIVNAIGNQNVDQIALVAAIRADLERQGGTLASRASQTSVDALGAPLQADAYTAPDNTGISAIKAKTDALVNAPTAAQTALAVRTELMTELARVDAPVSTRSTLTAQDIPAGLSAADVWTHATRSLTQTPGLTPTQAEQLRKVAQLHGVGAELVVTETSRKAGDVVQAIATTPAGTTVSAA